MARPSAGRPAADEPDDLAGSSRGKQTVAFWSKVKIDPIEIALPGGVGYTLRAYRMDSTVTPTDYSGREDVGFPDRAPEESEEFVFDDEDEDEEAAAVVDEEVPLFLSHAGHLLLFRSPEGLVEFVQSDAEHDLTQLDTWSRFTDDVQPEQIVADADDTYELDLVVKNLRGGHDVWDPDLIVKAGQIARDLGHALRMDKVVLAMAPGSPLDDLDEALRAVADGGIGTFFARRKAKKIGTETASLGWRTVIGKISAVVDWRD